MRKQSNKDIRDSIKKSLEKQKKIQKIGPQQEGETKRVFKSRLFLEDVENVHDFQELVLERWKKFGEASLNKYLRRYTIQFGLSNVHEQQLRDEGVLLFQIANVEFTKQRSQRCTFQTYLHQFVFKYDLANKARQLWKKQQMEISADRLNDADDDGEHEITMEDFGVPANQYTAIQIQELLNGCRSRQRVLLSFMLEPPKEFLDLLNTSSTSINSVDCMMRVQRALKKWFIQKEGWDVEAFHLVLEGVRNILKASLAKNGTKHFYNTL